MTEPNQKRKCDETRKRLAKHAALAGALAAIACQFLPHREICTAVVKVASLSCGAQ